MNSRVKEIRKSKTINLSQREFGRRLGVQDTAISKIESGERGLTEHMLLAICREFNVNEEWLRTGNGEMFSENDDTVIAAVAAEYRLNDLDQIILKAYIQLPEDKRKPIREFATYFARFVLDGQINLAHDGVVSKLIEHYSEDEAADNSYIREIGDIFYKYLPPITSEFTNANDTPPATPSKLEAIRNDNFDAIDDAEIEKEAEEFAKKAKQQFIFEKKQALQASSAKESGAG